MTEGDTPETKVIELNHAALCAIQRKLGDAFYILDSAVFTQNFLHFREAFERYYPRIAIGYSYKTNYIPRLCRIVNDLGGFAEVVSEMEAELAQMLGVRGERVIYNGPIKEFSTLSRIMSCGGIVNLDNTEDLAMAIRVAIDNPREHFKVGIRCNFASQGQLKSRFGFDVKDRSYTEAVSAINKIANLTLAGLHVHLPQRSLVTHSESTHELVEAAKQLPVEIEYLDVGGGFYGPMVTQLRQNFPGSIPSFDDYAKEIGSIVAKAYAGRASSDVPLLVLEPGTALVANAMRFCAVIRNSKITDGRKYFTAAGSKLNISPNNKDLEKPFKLIRREPPDHADGTAASLVGYTCIEADALVQEFDGTARVGDFVCFENVGSYTVVMKPPFIMPNSPVIELEDEEGSFTVVKRLETTSDVFTTFAL